MTTAYNISKGSAEHKYAIQLALDTYLRSGNHDDVETVQAILQDYISELQTVKLERTLYPISAYIDNIRFVPKLMRISSLNSPPKLVLFTRTIGGVKYYYAQCDLRPHDLIVSDFAVPTEDAC